MDVLRDIFNYISVLHYSFLVLAKCVIHCYFDYLEFGKTGLFMNADNPAVVGQPGYNPQGGGLPANQPQGGVQQANNWGNVNQLRANKINGPMQINDPNKQAGSYIPNGNNQPFLGNIKMALKHQYDLGNSTLSGYMFTPQQEQFILTHLLHTNREGYDKLMGFRGYIGRPGQDTPK